MIILLAKLKVNEKNLKQAFLGGATERMGIVAGFDQALDETFRAVRAINDARGDAVNGLE